MYIINFRTTFRATLFLFPLFGLNILIITNRNMVINETCEAETAYHLTSYIFEALQGVIVALLFCYTSAEVSIFYWWHLCFLLIYIFLGL